VVVEDFFQMPLLLLKARALVEREYLLEEQVLLQLLLIQPLTAAAEAEF
jgi:hypothetical protein